ncbi:helix-turn-helix domain-containing protein [Virgibacillus pantothenticus]|uniref:helix-turn-helix domain-containing protein n=1 Tax=Virgibacillus pantothenticus TaxID=1473 RepID=UPI0020B1C451|nr:helix-turn-helix transcriptional regulator [Virgibacillus pantothenticus]MEB5452826.1 helix-turn-helix transcriptional regulator [Virgibacillus pantothenticus]MEB5456927.1 helix-turn-helix transcriptional regulator [Virgibacillus pantothenticus]MEB5462045.1 helix-turn-helix transcriptional regulator [Virgibacillus pantothenticus]MEB5465319.1 helix-turn-helix transcriptional regulator [Virgibacillus pantothenticus]MEB5469773.1 helix-turn-helix transcriptional regulator [Virgibacillus pantoth
MHYSEFGAEARKIMLLKGISMSQLAEDLGISIYYLSEILKGTRPGKKYKVEIAKILEMEEF